MIVSDSAKADLQQFGVDLLRLRDDAGIPSYRALEKRAHYSRTTLAKAAGGKELPSLDVTLTFVSACGGDPEAWKIRWRQVRQALSARADVGSSPAAAASPWPLRPVEDGTDPDEAGCSRDAVTMHARRIAIAGRRRIIGQVELRYSVLTHAAWSRFRGYALLDHLASRHDIDIVVDVVRERDSKRATFKEPYAFDFLWGDLLMTSEGLFYACAAVLLDGEIAAYGETDKISLI
jgi:hypothetical protein